MWYPLVSCFKKTLILRMIRDSFCKELGANMTIAKCLRDCQLHAPLCINSKKSSWCFFFGWVEESCRQKLKKKLQVFNHCTPHQTSTFGDSKKSSHLTEPYLMSPSSCSLGDRMDFVLTLDWRTSVCSEVVWGNLKMMKAKLERAKRIFKERIEISIVLWRFLFKMY